MISELKKSVLKQANEHPLVYLQLLLERVEANPELIPVFIDALHDLGKWYQAQAAGLEAAVDLDRLVRGDSGNMPKG